MRVPSAKLIVSQILRGNVLDISSELRTAPRWRLIHSDQEAGYMPKVDSAFALALHHLQIGSYPEASIRLSRH